MSTFVYMTRCDGCGMCVDICPSDIMHIDKTLRRAVNIEPNMCWECYSCVKACDQNAIDARGYADFSPLGHSVRALREEESPYRVPQTEFEALLNAFGFKVSNKSIATLTVRAKADLQKKISLERYKIKIARQRLNNSQITMADYERILSDKRKKIYDLIEKYKLRLEGFDPYASRIRDDVTGFMGSGDSVSDYTLEEKEEKKYKMKEELLKLKQKKEQ